MRPYENIIIIIVNTFIIIMILIVNELFIINFKPTLSFQIFSLNLLFSLMFSLSLSLYSFFSANQLSGRQLEDLIEISFLFEYNAI